MSSIIERLRIAHRLALRAQHTSEFDTAALVRTWPRVAAAAAETFQSIPGTGAGGDLVVERIALDARSLGETIDRQPWPGTGRQDLALLQVAAALEGAASAGGESPVPQVDVAEARRLITSSLWTTAQLLGRTACDHAFDVRFDRKNFDADRGQVALLAKDTHRRFNAVEQLAAGSLRGRISTPASDVAGDLRRAVATWDVEAHRALLSNRSTTVLHVLAHQEAASVKAFEVFVDHARDGRVIDPVTAERLRPVLGDASASWAQLRDTAAEFSFANTAVPVAFIDAATGLRERFHDAIGTAGLEDHSQILGALTGHLASAVTISAAARDLITDGEMRAPARAIARLLAEQRPDLVAAPVDANAIHRGQSVRLTPEARDLLDEPARRVFRDADEALNRAAGLDMLYRQPPADTQREGSPAERSHTRPADPPAMSPGIGTGPTP